MNSKSFKNLYMALAVLFMTANTVYAKPIINSAVKSVVTKYGTAMMAIFIVSFLLYFGLLLYNKIFVTPRIYDCNLNKDSLRTPKNKEDAVLTFITRNRLG